MANEDLCYSSIGELAPLLKSRKLSPVELTRAFLDRIESLDSKVNCFISVTRQTALEQARAAEDEIRRGKYRGPLHGIPFAVKDLLATKGIRTTWGCRVFENQVFDYDATAVESLYRAGGILLGKNSMSELAGGPPGGAFNGPVHNPWKLTHWTSGSSTGPAACTASGFAVYSIGSETTASILGPSSTCGVPGLRPTYGRISRYGAMPLSWTMDKLGPICRRVQDCATVFAAMHGADPRDPTSVTRPFAFNPEAAIRGRRVGVVREDFDRAKEFGAEAAYVEALESLKNLGLVVEDVTLPKFPYREVNRFVWQVEGSSVFEPYARSGKLQAGLVNIQKWYGWKAAMLIPAADYMKVLRIRHAMVLEAIKLFEKYDALLAPLNPGGARPIEPKLETRIEGKPDYRTDLLTIGNLAGLPGVAVPIRPTTDGLPRGLTFVGGAFAEQKVLELAHAFERATDWHKARPAFVET